LLLDPRLDPRPGQLPAVPAAADVDERAVIPPVSLPPLRSRMTRNAAHGSRATLWYLARSAVAEIRISPSGATRWPTLDSCGRPLPRIVVSTDHWLVRAMFTASERSIVT